MVTLSKKAKELIENLSSFQDGLDDLEYNLEIENDELDSLQDDLNETMSNVQAIQKDIADKRKSVNKAQKEIDVFLANQRDNALKLAAELDKLGATTAKPAKLEEKKSLPKRKEVQEDGLEALESREI